MENPRFHVFFQLKIRDVILLELKSSTGSIHQENGKTRGLSYSMVVRLLFRKIQQYLLSVPDFFSRD